MNGGPMKKRQKSRKRAKLHRKPLRKTVSALRALRGLIKQESASMWRLDQLSKEVAREFNLSEIERNEMLEHL